MMTLESLKEANLRVCRVFRYACGTLIRNKAFEKLLDAVIEFMPSPLDIPSIKVLTWTATRLSVIPLMMSRLLLLHSNHDRPICG